jgi:hypothetical protein
MNLLAFLKLQASACLETQHFAQALESIDEALVLSQETQIVYERPELMRLKGEILLALSPGAPEKAREHFLQAAECAAAFEEKMWQLRAETSLARLWAQAGRQKEARDRLRAVYNWFTEGFDAADLIQAHNLLQAIE